MAEESLRLFIALAPSLTHLKRLVRFRSHIMGELGVKSDFNKFLLLMNSVLCVIETLDFGMLLHVGALRRILG